ncbi:MAG: alpha-amylase [Verrucomicrobia bacterium]|nr:MAG: alpha-amylase [Verrucomicrobiota bacterium]
MNHPLIYEIDARCWLRELSARHGPNITLGSAPDDEIKAWAQLGFTHVWLMGVWPTGPRSRAAALSSQGMRRAFSEALPGWQDDDVAGSPFAVADYTIARELGGESALKQFRKKLRAYGLKLLLDFVPNHLGLDHPWVSEKPELFVEASLQMPETFPAETGTGPRWLAHGKDPNFPAWIDTVQLDYRRADTRASMIEQLQSVAQRCDGVRCDMAMLLLNDVFAKTWEGFPCPAAMTEREFWADAIRVVKQTHPDFLFLGEVYWDLEARLQSLGFDYTYDKRLYDYLSYRNHAEVQRHLLGVTLEFIGRSAHFLENHDEPRIASILSLPEHRAAALLTLGLPGMRLVHHGQMTGARIKLPVQLRRRPPEPPRLEIETFYQRLLALLKTSAVGRGKSDLLRPRPAWPDNHTEQNFVVVQWQSQPDCFDLLVVNLAPHRSQCFVSLTVDGLTRRNWLMQDLLGHEEHQRFGDDLQNQGLYLDVDGHGAQLFHFAPV